MKYIPEKLINIIKERDFIAKVLCLFLAVALWGYIASTKSGDLKFRIPIEKKGLPAHMVISKISKKYAVIRLEGKKDILKSVNVKNIKAYINLRNPNLGAAKKYSVRLIKHQIHENVKISLATKEVEITVERKVGKKIKVIPRIIGNITEGKVVGKYKVNPEYIIATGASSIVNKIDQVYTENISIQDASDEIMRDVEIVKDNYNEVHFNETNIKVKIPIFDYKDLYSYKTSIAVRNTDPEYKYELKRKNVKLYFKASDNEAIIPEKINVFVDAGLIDIKKIMENKKIKIIEKTLPVTILFTDDLQNIEIISKLPEKVILKISKIEAE